MQKILFSDLYGQYLNLKPQIDAAIQEVIASSVFVKGGKVTEFEKNLSDYLGVQVVGCGNGTDALQLAFMALGLEEGDEIITVPFTFVSTVEAAVLLGLKPVFVDVCPETFNMDVSQLEAAITPRTKAILPVHLFGQCADMESILAVAKKYDLRVIEDTCQALGSEFIFSDGVRHKAGTIGDIACNSFFPSKNLGAFGDGGAVFTKNGKLAERIRSLANHGMSSKYNYHQIGINSRLDSIQAAILDVKLRYLEEHIQARQAVASFYDNHLGNLKFISLPGRAGFSTHSFHQYTLKTNRRDALQRYLKERDIPSMVYYPKPLHLQEAYRFLGYEQGDFPVSEELCKEVLSLPIHTEMDLRQLEFITKTICDFA